MVKLLGLDPGKQRDSFGIIAIDVRDDKIYVLNAQRVLGKKYIETESLIEKIVKENGYSTCILELNNTGQRIYESLVYERNLPVIAVTTSKDVKDMEKKRSLKVMDKNEMVRTMSVWFEAGKIIFPSRGNRETDELLRQLKIFAEHKTESGSVSYYAQGTEHDDLVMALMLCCWYSQYGPIKIIKI